MGTSLAKLMGETTCEKCSVQREYYYGKYPSKSCQIHRLREGKCIDCEEQEGGNCYHIFKQAENIHRNRCYNKL